MAHFELNTHEILINPKLPEREREGLLSALGKARPLQSNGHIWLTTSGTSGALKWVALSKEAILCSAKSVNERINSNKNDIWLNPLPTFHVGGLGIHARAFLSGARIIDHVPDNGKWAVETFRNQICDTSATLTSVVPTQIFDLVKNRCVAPKSLRAVFVGGGALNPLLYHQATELGWPLMPSYGMTECSSQIATASSGSFPLLKPLDHLELKLSPEGYLMIKGESLLSGYIFQNNGGTFEDPKVDGWFTTQDRVTFEGEMIVAVTRGSSFVKVGGESVDLSRLDHILEEVMITTNNQINAAIVASTDDRLGQVIALQSNENQDDEDVKRIVTAFNQKVLPFEKIRRVILVETIPRTALGKRIGH